MEYITDDSDISLILRRENIASSERSFEDLITMIYLFQQ